MTKQELSEQRDSHLRDELLARRECLVGAKQTLEIVAATLKNAQALDLVKTALLGPIHDRIVLVGEAIRNTDAAINGDGPKQRSIDMALEDLRHQCEVTDALAEALRPFAFDWDQAVSELEDHTEEDMRELQLGNTVDRGMMERAMGALELYERERGCRS